MTWWGDLKQGLRLLVRDWGFTVAAVATLSIGIAVNMMVFTLINGALLRDLPFADPDRIVEIRVFQREQPQDPMVDASYLDVLDSILSEIDAVDGVTLAAVPVLLGLVTLVACLVPASRAVAINPAHSLRAA